MKGQFAGIWMILVIFGSSCAPNQTPVYSKSGYELVLVEPNSVAHKGGRVELWDISVPSKRTLVWPDVIGDPQFHSNIVVFSASLSEERRWQFYPAVLAYSPGSIPVDITEMISKTCIATNGIPYRSIKGAYRFKPDLVHQEGLFGFMAAKLPEATAPGPFQVDVTVNPDEVSGWLQRLTHRGSTNSYEGTRFFVPEVLN